MLLTGKLLLSGYGHWLRLKGTMLRDDIAALGQFCAQVITLSAITHTQNAPVELWSSYHTNFTKEH